MLQCSTVPYRKQNGTVPHRVRSRNEIKMVQCRTVPYRNQHGTGNEIKLVQCRTVPYSVCCTVQYGAVQCRTMPCNAIRFAPPYLQKHSIASKVPPTPNPKPNAENCCFVFLLIRFEESIGSAALKRRGNSRRGEPNSYQCCKQGNSIANNATHPTWRNLFLACNADSGQLTV